MKGTQRKTMEAILNPKNKYLETAIQIQRWRDFGSHVFAYVLMNIVFIVIWALKGQAFFWPIYPLLGWGLGLSAQHFNVVIRGQITDKDVRHKLNANEGNI